MPTLHSEIRQIPRNSASLTHFHLSCYFTPTATRILPFSSFPCVPLRSHTMPTLPSVEPIRCRCCLPLSSCLCPPFSNQQRHSRTRQAFNACDFGASSSRRCFLPILCRR